MTTKHYSNVNPRYDHIYIESHQTSLHELLWHHKCEANHKIKNSRFYYIMENIGSDLFTMVLIEEMNGTRKELRKIEEYYINEFKRENPELSVNSIRAYSSKTDTRQRKHNDYLRYKATKNTLYYLKLLPFYDCD